MAFHVGSFRCGLSHANLPAGDPCTFAIQIQSIVGHSEKHSGEEEKQSCVRLTSTHISKNLVSQSTTLLCCSTANYREKVQRGIYLKVLHVTFPPIFSIFASLSERHLYIEFDRQ